MHFTSFLAVGVLAVLSSAAPADQEILSLTPGLGPRFCTIILPSFYQLVSRDNPKTSFQQSRLVDASQAKGGVSNVDTLFRFSGIPPGSFGCQLALSFTFEYTINSTGNSQVNIYSLPNDIQSSDTYQTYFPNGGRGIPKGASLFGTTTINGQRVVINSQVCHPNLNYLIEIASDTQAGSVTFLDAGDNLSGIGGFYLTYNC